MKWCVKACTIHIVQGAKRGQLESVQNKGLVWWSDDGATVGVLEWGPSSSFGMASGNSSLNVASVCFSFVKPDTGSAAAKAAPSTTTVEEQRKKLIAWPPKKQSPHGTTGSRITTTLFQLSARPPQPFVLRLILQPAATFPLDFRCKKQTNKKWRHHRENWSQPFDLLSFSLFLSLSIFLLY